MNALPGILNDNPMLDRWVAFPASGKVTIKTGRVEIGQGVLTAMAQIAADELDVGMARITIKAGDTELTPNEGYTAGSQAIQAGGIEKQRAHIGAGLPHGDAAGLDRLAAGGVAFVRRQFGGARLDGDSRHADVEL